jgi:hypothetical protein
MHQAPVQFCLSARHFPVPAFVLAFVARLDGYKGSARNSWIAISPGKFSGFQALILLREEISRKRLNEPPVNRCETDWNC